MTMFRRQQFYSKSIKVSAEKTNVELSQWKKYLETNDIVFNFVFYFAFLHEGSAKLHFTLKNRLASIPFP